jgi:hypothetical protein
VQAPNEPPNQDPFHSRPVKIASFHGPGHLLPAGNPSQIVHRTTPRGSPGLAVSSLASALRRKARLRPPTSAATEMASLSPTTPADFCNQRSESEHAGRTTQPRSRNDFSLLSTLDGCPPNGCEQHQPEASFGSHQKAAIRAGRRAHEPACTQRCRGPLKGTRTPRCRQFPPTQIGSLSQLRTNQGSPPNPPRERHKSLREPGCYFLTGSLTGEPIPLDRLARCETADSGTPFHWRSEPAFDVQRPSPPQADCNLRTGKQPVLRAHPTAPQSA